MPFPYFPIQQFPNPPPFPSDNSNKTSYNAREVVQLSQRDRAAACFSYTQKWKSKTGRQYFTDIRANRSTFNQCDVTGQQSNRIW